MPRRARGLGRFNRVRTLRRCEFIGPSDRGSVRSLARRHSPEHRLRPTATRIRFRSTAGHTRPQARRAVATSVRDARELKFLVMAPDHTLQDLANPGDVVLLLRLWLERAELARHQ